jgi:hypothetical protein
MILELRSYVLHSARFAEYVGMLDEHPEVVEVLRPYLRGFWSSESGLLNRVMHLYEYRDRVERAAVRAARAQLPVMKRFYADVLPMLQEQRSNIYEGKVTSPFATRGGVYHRLAIAFKPGVHRERSDRLASTLGAELPAGFKVAAQLQAHDLVLLLRSPSLQDRQRAQPDLCALIDDPGVAAVETDLWLPLGFSPLQ